MDILEATATYEAWLRKQVRVVAPDLDQKHRVMAKDAFAFLRGTFYRWASLWHEHCADLADAPHLLAIGDLHVENFGTWRDAEGRLVWGLNDADEATDMPYTLDLVRLATSALLAVRQHALAIGPKTVCTQILAGYREGIEAHTGRPFVLEERNLDLRAMVQSPKREPREFWDKIKAFGPVAAPREVRALLIAELPRPTPKFRIVHRTSGVGSLGRPRYVALAAWNSALLAREAKALVPSAYDWALGQKPKAPQAARLMPMAVRCPDPTLVYAGRWQIRRIAPRSARIELKHLPRMRDEPRLLNAMGCETANVHRGAGKRAAILKHLRRLDDGWLLAAARRMADATLDDWNLSRRHWKKEFKRRGH